MNTRTITSAVIAICAALTLASCGTTRDYPTSKRDYPQFPYPDGRYPDGRYPDGRYPYPDGRYPDRRYPDRRYPDSRTYPTSRNPHRMPPGHAKKVYGQKSAKVFAPGQQKHKKSKYKKHH